MTDAAEIGVFGGSGFYSLLEDVARSRWTRRTARRPTRSSSPRSPAGGWPSCRATAGATRSRRTRSTTARTSGRCARSASRRSSRRAPQARSSSRSSPAISSCATSSSTGPTGRADTFFDGPIVTHLSSAEIYDPVLRQLAIETIRDHGIEVHERGTVVVIGGPRFSTKAESKWFSDAGWQVINMTQYPEAWLCRELGMAVVNISLITDYDAGVLEGTEAVNATERARGLPAERRADPAGRARPDRAVPGGPRRPRGAGRARAHPRRRPCDLAGRYPTVRDGSLVARAAGAAADRRLLSDDPGRTRLVAGERPPPGRGRLRGRLGLGPLHGPGRQDGPGRRELDDPGDGGRHDLAGHRRAVRAQRHKPPPGPRGPDGRDAPDRQRRPAGPGDRHRRGPAASTPRTASISRSRPSGSPGSRRPSRSSARCGPAGRSPGSPLLPAREASARPVPVPPPPIIIGGETLAGARLAGRIGDGWTRLRQQFRSEPAALPRGARDGRAAARGPAGDRRLPGRLAERRGIAESPWVRAPRETWERWQAAGADGAIVLARTTADVDALVAPSIAGRRKVGGSGQRQSDRVRSPWRSAVSPPRGCAAPAATSPQRQTVGRSTKQWVVATHDRRWQRSLSRGRAGGGRRGRVLQCDVWHGSVTTRALPSDPAAAVGLAISERNVG